MADPDWCGGDYLAQGRNPSRGLAVARMAAHITYLSEAALHRKFGRKLQDRDQRHLRLRRRLPGRELSAPPGHRRFVDRFDANSYLYITRAMDYFDLAAEYGGVAGQRLPRHAGRASAWSPSPATGCSRPARAGPSCRRSTPSPPMSASWRSRPTRATTPSCSTSRNSSRPCAASSTGCAEHRGICGEAAVMPLWPTRHCHERSAPPRPRAAIRDRSAADRRYDRAAARGCSTSAAATARCSTISCTPRGRRPRHRAQPGGRQCLRRPGPVGHPGRRRHRSRRLSRRRLRLRHPVARPCRRRASRARCWSSCCASAAAPSSRSPISAIGACAGIC